MGINRDSLYPDVRQIMELNHFEAVMIHGPVASPPHEGSVDIYERRLFLHDLHKDHFILEQYWVFYDADSSFAKYMIRNVLNTKDGSSTREYVNLDSRQIEVEPWW